MDPKAKGEFLKKISINGFSIDEKETVPIKLAQNERNYGWRLQKLSGIF